MKTVLHLESDPDVLELSRIVLERQDFRYRSASSTEFGLLQIQEEIPDLIILSAGLNGTSAAEIARDVLAQPGTESVPLLFFCQEEEYRALRSRLSSLDHAQIRHLPQPTTYRGFLNEVKQALAEAGR